MFVCLLVLFFPIHSLFFFNDDETSENLAEFFPTVLNKTVLNINIIKDTTNSMKQKKNIYPLHSAYDKVYVKIKGM